MRRTLQPGAPPEAEASSEGTADHGSATTADVSHRGAGTTGSAPRPAAAPRARATLGARLRKDWQMLVLMVPGALALLLFFYIPILGNVIAFQDYQPYYTITEAPFVGLEKFVELFQDDRFGLALRNTLVYAAFQLVLFFPLPILLALVVDSMMSQRMRKAFQSIVYLPHFLSWVLVIALFQQMLGGAGLINQALVQSGMDPIPFMIIFLAALASIDQSLYESAAADGAGRMRRTWHITLPGMRPVIVLLLILNLGSILTVGFEQFILQRDAVGADTAEVLDTYSYYTGVIGGDWSMGAAAGLAKGVVGTILIVLANKVAHMLGEDGIYRGRPQ
jgi:putative aldouronate transport system permease protein